MLIYHNRAGEYSGDTAEEIIERLYELAKEKQAKAVPGEDFTKEDWWAYQRKTWRAMRGHRLPPNPDAGPFLKLMVEIGALTEGPKPLATRNG